MLFFSFHDTISIGDNMEDDKFKLDRLNIYLIVILCIVLVILVISSIRLAHSKKNQESKLPNLETTLYVTSTSDTTTTSTTTTTTTTTVPVNLSSPYYNVDTNILNEDIYKKNEGLDNDTAKLIVEGLVNASSKVFDTNDFSVFRTDIVDQYSKQGETDKFEENGRFYLELYNLDAYLAKVFDDYEFGRYLDDYYYGETPVFKKVNNKYYRLKALSDDNLLINHITIKSFDDIQIKASISFKYKKNSNAFKNADITLRFDETWKISKYSYPAYRR